MLFQEYIQKSRAIDVELSPGTVAHDMASALTLFLALSKLGKRVSFQGTNNIPPSFQWIDVKSLATRTAVLAIKEIAPFLSKISYEKTDRDFKLLLGLKESNSLRLEQIALEEAAPTDLTIIVGENSSQDNIEVTTNPHPKTKSQEKMREASLKLLSPFQIPSVQLFQKLLLKMQYVPEKKLSVAVLDKKDFRETQANPRDIGPLMKELCALGTFQTSHLVLFRSQGLLFSRTKELAEKISKFFKTNQKGNWALLKCQERETQRIKEKILFLL